MTVKDQCFEICLVKEKRRRGKGPESKANGPGGRGEWGNALKALFPLRVLCWG